MIGEVLALHSIFAANRKLMSENGDRMMKRYLSSLKTGSLVVSLILLVSSGAFAVPDPIPGFSPDMGVELFTPSDYIVSVEIYDVGNSYGSIFGFFYESDPDTLIPIFGGEDVGAFPTEVSMIDFQNGFVYDLPSWNVQSSFTPLGGNIGFYLQPFAGLVTQNNDDPNGLQDLTLYTVNSLNPFGYDAAGVYDCLTNPGYLIGFGIEFPGAPEITLSYHFVEGLKPVPIPEPATLTLLGSGMVALLALRKRK